MQVTAEARWSNAYTEAGRKSDRKPWEFPPAGFSEAPDTLSNNAAGTEIAIFVLIV